MIVAVGKLHGAYWRAAQQEYLARLCRYMAVTLIEVKDVVGRGTPNVVAWNKGEVDPADLPLVQGFTSGPKATYSARG